MLCWCCDQDLEIDEFYTEDEVAAMIESQSGVCQICKQPPGSKKILCVDHNHTTGKIRGMLCDKCNRFTGSLEKNGELFQKIGQYLKDYE